MAMLPEQVEALIEDLHACRAQADVLRWRNRIYLMALRTNRKRLAREIARARRGWAIHKDEGDEPLA